MKPTNSSAFHPRFFQDCNLKGPLGNPTVAALINRQLRLWI